jgi:hypothetical protein
MSYTMAHTFNRESHDVDAPEMCTECCTEVEMWENLTVTEDGNFCSECFWVYTECAE